MSAKSGRKKGTTQKILDLLPQDLVKSIVIKILERAEGVRNSLNSDDEIKPKPKPKPKPKSKIKKVKTKAAKTKTTKKKK